MAKEIMVSIVCNAFNHEKYIGTALDSFLMQQADFAFEILVHDDASTDHTAEIIQEYAEKYPDIVLPCLQRENQYSKGTGIFYTFQFPRARGKYIAICEGDDYWTDPLKLQKQVDAMERHPEADICAHRADTMRDGVKTGEIPALSEDTVFTVGEVIAGDGGFVNTATLMLRTSAVLGSYQFPRKLALDYSFQILGALRGGMLYLGDSMAVYRQMTPGSWSSNMYRNREKEEKHLHRVAEMLRCVDAETEYRYTKVIQARINKSTLMFLENHNEYRALLTGKYREIFNSLSGKHKLKICLSAAFPRLVAFRRKCKQKQ